MARIAIMGHGVVGGGVAELLLGDNKRIADRCDEEVELKYILDLRDFSSLSYSNLFTRGINDIIKSDVDTVVEAIGGIKPAYEFVKACLNAGKNVVTSNKELVAVKGEELLKIAEEKNVRFLFEASVGGGIPIIRPLKTSLCADGISSITGILNGTTNYILTAMSKDGVSFDDALKEAQRLGYAERNPEADVKGIDACRKICILADIITGETVTPDDVRTLGIDNITAEQTEAVKKLGGAVKLIGRAEISDNVVSVIVSPFAVMPDNPLCFVNDVFNGILVEGVSTGRVTFMGRGAGKLPTASAMIADIVDCTVNKGSRYNEAWSSSGKYTLANQDDFKRVWLIKTGADMGELADSKAGENLYFTRPVSITEIESVLKKEEIGFILPVLL